MHPRTGDAATHWDDVYRAKATDQVSWFQRDPEVPLLLSTIAGSVVDIGAGASTLADRLLGAGRTDLTLLDVSSAALQVTRGRLGSAAKDVTIVTADVQTREPARTFDCWHDRAVFHFLVDPDDRAHYVQRTARIVATGGSLVLGTFAADWAAAAWRCRVPAGMPGVARRPLPMPGAVPRIGVGRSTGCSHLAQGALAQPPPT